METKNAEKELVQDERLVEIEKAKELLEQIENEKNQQFIKEYEDLCIKYNRRVDVQYQMVISKIQ